VKLLLPGLLLLGVLGITGTILSIVLARVRRLRLDQERHLRLAGLARTKKSGGGGDELAEQRETGGALGRRLRAVFAARVSHNWGMTAGPLPLIIAGCGGGGVTWLVLKMGLQVSIWIALTGCMAAFFMAPRALLKHQQEGADQKFMAGFPDTIDMVTRMLRAGLPITSAIREVGQEAPAPVAQVFANLADQMAIGIAFEDALVGASQRIGLADFRFFAVAISLQRATGGNLAATLDILSDIMRRRRAMRLKARAVTGEARMSAIVLGVIPFLVFGALAVTSPGYLAPLFSDPRGKVILVIAATFLTIGFGIIRHLMRSVTSVG